MVPYFLLLFLPSVFALLNTRKLSLFLWYITFTVFVVFVGLRFQVGPDWQQYEFIHTSIAYESFWEVIAQPEPLSYLLFWISETSGYHVYGSNLVAAVIMLIGVFAFARRTANPWVALVSATPYFIIVMGMSGVRQTMAAGIILFLFSRWERYSLIKRGAYILVAAMFHTSALINNVFLVIKLNIAMRYKLALGAVITVVTLYISLRFSVYSDNMMQYQQRYIDSDLIDESYGSLYHIAMIAVPALLGYLYRRRIAASIYSASLLNFGLYASMFIFVLNFFSSTVASRLTVYLYFVPMMVYPALVQTLGKRAQMASIFAVILFHMLILLMWFNFGNHAFAYDDYKNVLFSD